MVLMALAHRVMECPTCDSLVSLVDLYGEKTVAPRENGLGPSGLSCPLCPWRLGGCQ